MKRLESLDFLRGGAILGMLIANVPWHTGTSMSRIHELDWPSVSAWLVQYAVVDQRFMPIFCMLFGAGALLLAEGRDQAPGFGRYYLRRMGVLFLIGLAHAYLLWPGDILLTYAICGPILLLFLRAGPLALLAWGIGFKLVDIAFLQWPVLYSESFHRLLFSWWLEIGEAPMSEAAAYAGSYSDLLSYNAWRNQFIQWTAMPFFRMWNALGFMLIGMALYRWGVLQAQAGPEIYRRMVVWGLGLGVPVLIYGLLGRVGSDAEVGPFLGWTQELPLRTAAHMTGCALTAIALLGGLLMVARKQAGTRWTGPVRAVGRMALTNYVLHSVIFLVIFAGFGWVPYDSLDPDERLLWVVGIWAVQLTLSPLWLRRFGQGPLERVWRIMAGAGPRRSAPAAQV